MTTERDHPLELQELIVTYSGEMESPVVEVIVDDYVMTEIWRDAGEYVVKIYKPPSGDSWLLRANSFLARIFEALETLDEKERRLRAP